MRVHRVTEAIDNLASSFMSGGHVTVTSAGPILLIFVAIVAIAMSRAAVAITALAAVFLTTTAVSGRNICLSEGLLARRIAIQTNHSARISIK